MLINQHIHIKGRLNIRHCSSDVKYHAIRMLVGHGQVVRLREGDDCLIILLGRTKVVSELNRCEVLTKIGAGRVVDLLKQVFEALLVAERQRDARFSCCAASSWPIGWRFATAAGTVPDRTWLPAIAGIAANKAPMAAANAKVTSHPALRW